MDLHLFQFIEETMTLYDLRLPSFSYAENVLKRFVTMLYQQQSGKIVNVYSRVKNRDSLREKLLRNRFYLNYTSPQEALNHVSDLVGITVECRFISEEAEIFQRLKESFYQKEKGGWFVSDTYHDIQLNLSMIQPQIQRNGFAIYRVDGRFQFNGEEIGFELQIKALVHRFWAEIEHEVVYKNDETVIHDQFMKSLLTSIRDNLDVVDHQLQLVYEEMLKEGNENAVGLSERSFKNLVTISVNELLITKMKEELGFSTYFRKDAQMIAQYVYIRFFLQEDNPELRMVSFLEDLNLLSKTSFGFKEKLAVPKVPSKQHSFVTILVTYFIRVINIDFEWHAFFVLLQRIQNADLEIVLFDFAKVYQNLIMNPSWYEMTFSYLKKDEQQQLHTYFSCLLATAISNVNSTKMLHEDYVLRLSSYFHTTIEHMQDMHFTYEQFQENEKSIHQRVMHEVLWLFK